MTEPDQANEITPASLEAEARRRAPLDEQPPATPQRPPARRIIQLVEYRQELVALTADGAVWMWNARRQGRWVLLSRGDDLDETLAAE